MAFDNVSHLLLGRALASWDLGNTWEMVWINLQDFPCPPEGGFAPFNVFRTREASFHFENEYPEEVCLNRPALQLAPRQSKIVRSTPTWRFMAWVARGYGLRMDSAIVNEELGANEGQLQSMSLESDRSYRGKVLYGIRGQSVRMLPLQWMRMPPRRWRSWWVVIE